MKDNPKEYLHQVKVWDASNGKRLALLKGHKDVIGAVTFSPSGAWIASGGRDGAGGDTIRIWDVPRAVAAAKEGK